MVQQQQQYVMLRVAPRGRRFIGIMPMRRHRHALHSTRTRYASVDVAKLSHHMECTTRGLVASPAGSVVASCGGDFAASTDRGAVRGPGGLRVAGSRYRTSTVRAGAGWLPTELEFASECTSHSTAGKSDWQASDGWDISPSKKKVVTGVVMSITPGKESTSSKSAANHFLWKGIWRETCMHVRMWNVIGTMSTILSPPDARIILTLYRTVNRRADDVRVR